MNTTDKFPLKAHRAKAGMTQQEVAEHLNINRNTYSKWERYETFPDAIQLIELAYLFGCSMDAFYFPINASFKLVIDSEKGKIDSKEPELV